MYVTQVSPSFTPDMVPFVGPFNVAVASSVSPSASVAKKQITIGTSTNVDTFNVSIDVPPPSVITGGSLTGVTAVSYTHLTLPTSDLG